MTPAINQAKRHKIWFALHPYQADPNSDSYGEAAAKALNLDSSRVFKTLITVLNGNSREFGVALVPVSSKLDLKLFSKVLGIKSALMAEPADAQRITGYVVGGISPLGQKNLLPTVADQTLTGFKTVFVSAGKRGLQIELKPEDLISLTKALTGPIVR